MHLVFNQNIRSEKWNNIPLKNIELFGCKSATAKSWRYGLRQPSIEQAKVIIKKTGGKLDFESIYGPIDNSVEEKKS
jgi:hypothetical protein